jgi:hypothetical protein
MQAEDNRAASVSEEQRLAGFEAQAEQAYGKMCDATHSTEAAARYSDATEAMRDAIALGRRLWSSRDGHPA